MLGWSKVSAKLNSPFVIHFDMLVNIFREKLIFLGKIDILTKAKVELELKVYTCRVVFFIYACSKSL
jgi:hypothetical protein